MRFSKLLRRFGPAFWAAVVLVLSPARGGEPILKGYADYETYRKQLESIAGSRFASLRSLGRTLGGREVYLLEIGVGKRDEKPAILVVGGVYPPHLVGSELAVRLARRLVDQAAGDKAVAAMLERVTFYVIPRPSPDACEALFRRPYWERAGNERPTDDDHDGLVDEDGPDDLNGDGLITMMRVEDPAGTYMPHPKDPRVLVRADREKNQRGRWLVYSEGIDNDKDGEFRARTRRAARSSTAISPSAIRTSSAGPGRTRSRRWRPGRWPISASTIRTSPRSFPSRRKTT